MAYSNDDAEAYANAYTRACTKIKSEIYAGTYAKVYIDAIIEAKAEAYAKAYAEAYAKAYPVAYAKARIRKEVATAEVEQVAKAEAEQVAKAEAEPVAKAEPEPTAKAKAEAEAKAEAQFMALCSLYNLATDCLRLSTYFFHPIQQCAQQVYHTAVPLSPISTVPYESCLQYVVDNQLSHVTAFSGASNTWGSLLRAIDLRPRQLTCIGTCAQWVIAACEDIVNIYSAVTFASHQSLHTPETVIKIQGSLDGSTLFFAHSFSVTVWDVQTGGLIHTFTVQSKISDMVTSATHVACGSSDGCVILWNIHTKEEIKNSGNGQPVVNIFWLPDLQFAVVTQYSICIRNLILETLDSLSIPDQVWGAVYFVGGRMFIVGTSPGERVDQEQSHLTFIYTIRGHLYTTAAEFSMLPGQLTCPVIVGNKIAYITPPSGVQMFNIDSRDWTNNPPLLKAAISLDVSTDRNLVVQTKDSIQFFPIGVLGDKAHKGAQPSHIYPLGKNHIICTLQPTRHLTLLELETLEELYPDNNNLSLESFLTHQLASTCGLIAEYGISMVVGAWQSGNPLPKQMEENVNALLCGWSPEYTWTAIVYNSPQHELCLKDGKDGTVLANLPLGGDNLGMGEVYEITFSSETRFYLKTDGPGQHLQIPYDIITSPSGSYSHTIIEGEPAPLSEPRPIPPYRLDTNCEWVLDMKSRKICWIPPTNLRKGDGGHFWAGLSLIMLGDDGVVRKLTFKDPDC